MQQQKEEIIMLDDMLDYLNAHALRELLEKNEKLLSPIDQRMRTTTRDERKKDGTVTRHRELVTIRQNLLRRLGKDEDRDQWFDTH